MPNLYRFLEAAGVWMNAQHSASINAEQNFTRFRVFARLPKHDFAKGLNGKGCKQTEWLFKGKSPI